MNRAIKFPPAIERELEWWHKYLKSIGDGNKYKHSELYTFMIDKVIELSLPYFKSRNSPYRTKERLLDEIRW